MLSNICCTRYIHMIDCYNATMYKIKTWSIELSTACFFYSKECFVVGENFLLSGVYYLSAAVFIKKRKPRSVGKTNMYALSQFTEFSQYLHGYLAAPGKTFELLIVYIYLTFQLNDAARIECYQIHTECV